MSLRAVRFTLVIALVAAASTPAIGDRVVVEAYTGERPADAGAVVAPVLEELARRGFVAGATSVGRAFEAAASRPGLAADLPAAYKADAERARTAWARGQFDDALALAAPIVDAARANPGALVLDQSLREPLRTALIAIALSRRGKGDAAGMREAFGELARAFPGAPLGAEYGPAANREFEATRTELARRPGTLTVRVSDESLGVYVSEKLEGVGTTRRADAIPGEYRIVARKHRELSRSYRAIVRPGEDTVVTIDLALDSAVHSGPDWAGLVFASAADRTRMEGVYAAQLAGALASQDVVVVGIDERRGRRVVVGARINLVNGKDVRRATVEIEAPPRPEQLRALARYLTGDPVSTDVEPWPEIERLGPVDAEPPLLARQAAASLASSDDSAAPRWRGWPWVTGSAAIVAIGTGATLLAFHGRCATEAPMAGPCIDEYQTRGAGLAVLGAGALLAGATAYLWLTGETSSSPSTTAAIAPVPGGAIAGVTTRF